MNKWLPNGYLHRTDALTKSERVAKRILKANNAYYESQPVVFSTTLNRQIRPDFLVHSWKNKPTRKFFLEVDGNYKDLSTTYQVLREQGLKYPVLRIRNSEVENLSSVIEEFIK